MTSQLGVKIIGYQIGVKFDKKNQVSNGCKNILDLKWV